MQSVLLFPSSPVILNTHAMPSVHVSPSSPIILNTHAMPSVRDVLSSLPSHAAHHLNYCSSYFHTGIISFQSHQQEQQILLQIHRMQQQQATPASINNGGHAAVPHTHSLSSPFSQLPRSRVSSIMASEEAAAATKKVCGLWRMIEKL